jgi:cytochrome c556
MPEGMKAAGSAMHRAASRFAVEAQNSTVTGDLKPALGVLSEVMSACVACHAGFRLK